MPSESRCVILVPVGGAIEPDRESNLRELERRGYPVRRIRGYSAIDLARNQMATDALAQGFDELLWIDSDIVFDPNDIDKLRQHNLPLVCGIYAKKGPRQFACSFLPQTRQACFGDKGGLLEIHHCGFGFVLTRRSRFDTIRRQHRLPECNRRFGSSLVPYFAPLVAVDGKEPLYLSEDYAFCERARQGGVPIMADTTIRLRTPNSRIAFHDSPDPGWPDVRRVVDDYARRLRWRRIAQANYLGVFHISACGQSSE